jgi:hypothetical protein
MTIRRDKHTAASDGARVRRDAPARTAPLRAWPGSLRTPDSWDAREDLAGVAAKPRAQADHGVDGVKLGYEVIERHMRRAAKPRKMIADTQSEIQNTIAQLFRSLAELMPLMANLVNSPGAAAIAQNLLFNNPLRQPVNNNGSHDTAARVDVELSSPRPATVAIELHAEAERRALTIAGLHDRRGHKLTLAAIAFAPAKGRKGARLRIRIPDGQRPGIYSGVLLDRSTSEPHGILTVRVAR